MNTTKDFRQNDVERTLDGMGFKLCDLNKMPIKGMDPQDEDSYVARKGIIKVVPVKAYQMVGGGKSQSHFTRKVVWDLDERIVYGQSMGMTPNGNFKWKTVEFSDERTFNLAKEGDRRDFYILLHDANMQGGPRFKGDAKFKMINPEKEAQEFNQKRRIARTAEDIVDNLSQANGLTELSDFAVQFGFDPAQSEAVLRRLMIEKAMTDPDKVVARFNDPNRKIWVIVKKARLYGVITQEQDGLYFGGTALGASEDNAVERIRLQPEMQVGLQDSIKEKTIGKVVLPIGKKPAAEKSVADNTGKKEESGNKDEGGQKKKFGEKS